MGTLLRVDALQARHATAPDWAHMLALCWQLRVRLCETVTLDELFATPVPICIPRGNGPRGLSKKLPVISDPCCPLPPSILLSQKVTMFPWMIELAPASNMPS